MYVLSLLFENVDVMNEKKTFYFSTALIMLEGCNHFCFLPISNFFYRIPLGVHQYEMPHIASGSVPDPSTK